MVELGAADVRRPARDDRTIGNHPEPLSLPVAWRYQLSGLRPLDSAYAIYKRGCGDCDIHQPCRDSGRVVACGFDKQSRVLPQDAKRIIPLDISHGSRGIRGTVSSAIFPGPFLLPLGLIDAKRRRVTRHQNLAFAA